MNIETILQPLKKEILQFCGRDEYYLKDYFRDGLFNSDFKDRIPQEEIDFISQVDVWDCVEYVLKKT